MTTKQKIIISLFIIIGLAMAFLGGVAATVMFNNNSIFGAILVTMGIYIFQKNSKIILICTWILKSDYRFMY